MLFEKKDEDKNDVYSLELQQYEYKKKYGFLDELRNAVRTDEEYAKFKGYIE